ncbi:TrkH family potassium uptake protein [Nitrospirota bacterium]
MNYAVIVHITGSVLVIISLFMLPAVAISAANGQPDLKAMVLSAALTMSVGLLMHFYTIKNKRDPMRHRDVFLAVTVCWLSVSFFGSLPYLFSGAIEGFTEAYFEAVAGFTTTGATIFKDIEALPLGLLFWRSLTQWIGGMGIIIFALAVLPFIGSGGVQLFKAEAPELTVDRLRPRLIDTAKVLWYIYASLTVLAAVLYRYGGMSWFDAICHGLTTLATGGFSTKNSSIAYYDSAYIDAVSTFFMFMAGINYTLYFNALRGNLGRFWQSSEFRFYIIITSLAIAGITLHELNAYGSLVDSLRYASFQVISIMTTTGFATADYELWSQHSQMVLMCLMFFGGMIGSTAGGMKQVRVLLMLKQGYRELYMLIHPRAITSLKLDGKNISKELVRNIWGFLFLFLFICTIGMLLLTATGVDLVTAATTVLSATSNVGPALGDAGPTDNYTSIPDAGKWVLIFCMLAGRLEIYTVVILLLPIFWKK